MNLLEDNYMNYINIVTDDRIKGKINNIRLALIKLGNILSKNDRKRIKEELYVIEKRQNLTNAQKDRIYNYLIERATALDKIEAYKYHNYNDLDYFGIRDIENSFDNIDDLDYYKPILTKSSFNSKYEYYEIRGDRHKNLSIKQYLTMIKPELAELINKKKKNNELKMQLSMGVNFMHTADRDKNCTFHVKSDNAEIRLGDDTNDIINKLFESFLNNYQKEEQILRNGSNYTFESVDILGIHFHNIKLKRGSS